MVKYLTHNPKIKGSNPAANIGRVKSEKCRKMFGLVLTYNSSTMVKHLTHNLKIKGSNPATDIEREKNVWIGVNLLQ
jgi:hypothetical protein